MFVVEEFNRPKMLLYFIQKRQYLRKMGLISNFYKRIKKNNSHPEFGNKKLKFGVLDKDHNEVFYDYGNIYVVEKNLLADRLK